MSLWINSAQYATEVLALVLIVRLAAMRVKLEGVYVLFIAFLVFQLLMAAEYFIASRWFPSLIDYRIVWLASTFVLWFFSLALVYSLAKAVLAELPGILRFSRILLNVVFPLAILVALSTVNGEYLAAGGSRYGDPLDRLLIAGYVLDRCISMAALLVLVMIVGFILWFPVTMPRNLAIFCVGFLVYFGSKTFLALARSYSARDTVSGSLTRVLGTVAAYVLVGCFIYWITFISRKGQTIQVRLGHSWRAADQTRLVGQLESLNLALLRNSQHLKL